MVRDPDATAQLSMLPAEQGGRRNPISSGYRPHFRLNGEENGVEIALVDTDSFAPGDSGVVELRFVVPHLQNDRLEIGLPFEIAEGKQVVATGFIAEICNPSMQKAGEKKLYAIYVDVDDTLIRSAGMSRIPIARSIEYVKTMHSMGHTLFCWSRGGEAYAREVAHLVGLEGCFTAFLPKPDVVFDDMLDTAFRHCEFRHPNNPYGASDG